VNFAPLQDWQKPDTGIRIFQMSPPSHMPLAAGAGLLFRRIIRHIRDGPSVSAVHPKSRSKIS
jgi:hypothetical protein